MPGSWLHVLPTVLTIRFSMLRWSLFLLAIGCAVGRAASLPANVTLNLGSGVTMDFVLIPAGTFLMGSGPDVGDSDETPQHRVTIAQPFYLGCCEVTQRQWTELIGSNPSRFPGATRPVENVSWNDCQRFLAALAKKTGRAAALPTEAQWEYACRAGSTTRWYFGDDERAIGAHAWVGANAHGATHAVGTKPPNAWGVYDLCGNVWEWCADWYGRPDPATVAIDPVGPAAGTARVLRGGAWGDDANQARSAYRNSMGPDQHNPGTGFRCVLLTGAAPSPPLSP